MAVPTSTFETYDAIGNREDLIDRIFMVSPIKTPFLSLSPKVKATGVLHEWQTDALDAAASNVVAEGDDATTTASTATVRLSNSCQLSDKVPRVTSTQEAVNKAGRKSEMAHQIAKNAFALKRDMEDNLLSNNAEVTGSSGTGREHGGVPAWITTNTSNGTSGSDGSLGNTARTDGTQRALTEALLKTVLAACWDSGGDPDCIMVGSFNKQAMSGFTGNATRFKTAEDRTLMASIDLYDSDFGTLAIIPNRFMRSRDCLVFEKRMWGIAFLQAFRIEDLAKTGHTERKMLSVEYSLESRNEAASGAVWDLSVS